MGTPYQLTPEHERVASYATKSEIEHLSMKGEKWTLCGRERTGWMVLEKVGVNRIVSSPYTCKRCLRTFL